MTQPPKDLWVALVEHESIPGTHLHLLFQASEPSDDEILRVAASAEYPIDKLYVAGVFSISHAVRVDQDSRTAWMAAIHDHGFATQAMRPDA